MADEHADPAPRIRAGEELGEGLREVAAAQFTLRLLGSRRVRPGKLLEAVEQRTQRARVRCIRIERQRVDADLVRRGGVGAEQRLQPGSPGRGRILNREREFVAEQRHDGNETRGGDSGHGFGAGKRDRPWRILDPLPSPAAHINLDRAAQQAGELIAVEIGDERVRHRVAVRVVGVPHNVNLKDGGQHFVAFPTRRRPKPVYCHASNRLSIRLSITASPFSPGEVAHVRDQIREAVSMALIAALPLMPMAALSPARAQQAAGPTTFGTANTLALTQICTALRAGPTPGLGPNLASVCTRANASGQGLDVSGAGIITATPSSTTQREQSKEAEIREAEEKGSGGSADSQAYRLAGNISLFVAAGGDSVIHRASGFEEPYHGSDASFVVGAGAHPVNWLTYGVGFDYRYLQGNFEDLGGFHVTTYRPFLYASFVPFDGAFIDTEIGYARFDNTRNRGANVVLQPSGTTLSRGIATGTPGENAYDGSILAGYDRRFGMLSVGPRIGVNAGHYAVAGYTETGQTGLELRYGSVDQNSLQSVVGAAANLVIATDAAIVLPGVSASWVHEFEAYPRLIHAQFVQAPGSPSFSFSSERPAADFGVLELHVTAILPSRLRAFADFSTVAGNGHYESYGGTLGVAYAF